MADLDDRTRAEERFAAVFAHVGALSAYAARRGSADPEGIAAETMAIAWRRLADVPTGDPRPWLFATARNLAWAEWRSRRRSESVDPGDLDQREAKAEPPGLAEDLDPAIAAALRHLPEIDREALLLIAWEELTPAQAAASLGIKAAAFRVRLHRARRRFRAALEMEKRSGRPTSKGASSGSLEARDPTGGETMSPDPALEALRSADPAPTRASVDCALFDAIVARPGDPRLTRPRRRRRRTRYLVAIAAAVALSVGTALAASGESPLAIFTVNPQEGPPGSPFHQEVLAGTVHAVGAATIPDVGRMTFWYARTRQGGWCSGIRLPSGDWAGTLTDPLDAGGSLPGCQSGREQINAAGPAPVFEIDGFDYDEVLIDARPQGHGFWRVYFGEVAGRPRPTTVTDRVSGSSTAVKEGHLFVLAVPSPHPMGPIHLHLVATDRAGAVVADTAPASAGGR